MTLRTLFVISKEVTVESRTVKSIKNSTVAMVYYIATLLLQFISRKVFLDYLGTEILGLNTTVVNLIQFLNLAELGITQAVSFTLYKPLKDNDYKSINEIVTLQGHLYKRVAVFIIAGACILMAFFPMIFQKADLPIWYAYASFLVLLFSTLLGYFVNYKQVVLTASQQDYKVAYSYRTVLLIKIVAQIAVMQIFPYPYIWWLVLEFFFAIVASISISKMTSRTFPRLCIGGYRFGDLRRKYPIFITKVKQMFFHKVVGVVILQSSPFIIYAFTTLTLVAIYGNYMILIQGATLLFQTIFNSVGAGIGNLVTDCDDEKAFSVFNELFSVRFFLLMLISTTIVLYSKAFISLWIGGEYIMEDTTVILMVAIMFFTLIRTTWDSFLMAYGMVNDIFSPITEGILNIGLSILLGYFYGLNGILSGCLISLVVIGVGWRPLFLFHWRLRGFYGKFLFASLKHVVLTAAMLIIGYMLLDNTDVFIAKSWISLVCKMSIFVIVSALLYGGLLCVFQCGLKTFMYRMIELSKRMFYR